MGFNEHICQDKFSSIGMTVINKIPMARRQVTHFVSWQFELVVHIRVFKPGPGLKILYVASGRAWSDYDLVIIVFIWV